MPAPLRVCLLTTAYPTWNEGHGRIIRGKFVHDMAKYLVRGGAEVHVVTQREENTPEYEERDGVGIHRFRYFLNGHETLTTGAGIPENIKKLRNKLLVPFYVGALAGTALRVMRSHGVGVINAHWGVPTGWIGLLLKRLTRAKLVTTLYGAELFPYVARGRGPIRRLLESALRGADMLAGISAETVQAARSVSGRNDIHVIPDGIDMEYYVPGEADRQLLEKYNCLGRRVVFFTGRMVERKGHRYLIEAMKYVASAQPEVKLLLGGDGPLSAGLQRLRAELGLEDVVEMPGFLPEEDLVPILQSADLHVLPSCIDAGGDTEGSATAAFEAMACGTPSIVSRVGGNIGAVEEGKGACYFEPGNSRELADRILMLLGSAELLEKYRAEARAFVAANYSWEKSIEKYLKLMRE